MTECMKASMCVGGVRMLYRGAEKGEGSKYDKDVWSAQKLNKNIYWKKKYNWVSPLMPCLSQPRKTVLEVWWLLTRGANDLSRSWRPSTGILEAAKVLDMCQAHLCVLAFNYDEPVYVDLVEVLCAEHQINLIKVDYNKIQGEWVGLCKTDQEEEPHKEDGCS